jgi:hypothetical protein
LRGKQFMGRLVALCFLPHAALLASEEIDHQGQGFQAVGPDEGTRNQEPGDGGKPELMEDENDGDRDGTLRLRLVHDFVDRDLKILRSMIRPRNVEIADGYDVVPSSVSVETGDFVGVTKIR